MNILGKKQFHTSPEKEVIWTIEKLFEKIRLDSLIYLLKNSST